MAERFRDLMLERTDGQFRVSIYPSGQLGGERVAFEQIQVGAVHMAISGTPVLSGWVPEGQMFDLPYLFETRDHGLAVMNGPVGDWWRDLLLERTGVRSLGFLDYGFRHVYNKRRAVETPADLDGLKLRVLQNATYLAAYSALGVQATPMNYGEVYSALQQGVIEGGEANAIGFVSSRLYEVAKFYSFTSITYNPITFLVNEPFYQSLPADVQEAVDDAAAQALAYQSEVARRMETDALEQMRVNDVEISRPDVASFVPAVRPHVWDELAARLPDGEALIARLVDEVGRMRP
jgi:C4-dicarboxylate-binding protein DctP